MQKVDTKLARKAAKKAALVGKAVARAAKAKQMSLNIEYFNKQNNSKK